MLEVGGENEGARRALTFFTFDLTYPLPFYVPLLSIGNRDTNCKRTLTISSPLLQACPYLF